MIAGNESGVLNRAFPLYLMPWPLRAQHPRSFGKTSKDLSPLEPFTICVELKPPKVAYDV